MLFWDITFTLADGLYCMTRSTFSVSTDQRLEVLDVTDQVARAIPDGADDPALVFTQHTTAAVTINEAETRLLSDFETALDSLVESTGWQHDQIDDNADAHLRAMLIGPSATVPVRDGDLNLGTWQSILFVECDGPRTRTVIVDG
jgi:secondary thiamine-phosphate synthase enzyme